MVVPESFQLDQEILLDAGAQLHRLKMYPYFDIAHYLLNTNVYTILDSIFLPLRVHVHRLGGLLPIWPVVVSDVLHVDEKIWCLLLQMSLDFWTELWCVDELGKMSEGSGINLKSSESDSKFWYCLLTYGLDAVSEEIFLISQLSRQGVEILLGLIYNLFLLESSHSLSFSTFADCTREFLDKNVLESESLDTSQLTSKTCWGGEPAKVLSARIDRDPAEMMFNESIESSGSSLIGSREALQLSLVEVLYKIIDDDRTVGMLTSVQLDERDLLTSGHLAELIVDILKSHLFNLVVRDYQITVYGISAIRKNVSTLNAYGDGVGINPALGN